MSVSVSMPQLGESVTEGTVTRWLKKEGERVEADEPLLEVSTDKVDTEIPSPVAGVLRGITVAEDETVAVGAELAVIDEAGAQAAQADQGYPAAPPAAGPEPGGYPYPGSAPEPQQPAPAPGTPSQEPAYTQQTPAYSQQAYAPPAPPAPQAPAGGPPPETGGQAGAGAGAQAPAPPPAPAPAPAATSTTWQASPPQAPPAPPANGARATSAPLGGGDGPYVTPLVRKLAAEHGVDLATVTGTGVGGRIRKHDVLAASRAQREAAPSIPQPSPAIDGQLTPGQGGGQQGQAAQARPPIEPSSLRGTTERMSRARQLIARRMVESLQTSAQLTTVVEVDVTAIARLRDRAKADFEAREGVKLTFLPFFALAAVEALKVHPKLNASIEPDGNQVTYHDAEHLGIAVDTERGLMVPVVRNAGDLNVGGLARKIADLATRTRAGQVSPDDLAGGTFTLTNTGSRGALFDTPIINQPQVGILGTGTVVKRPVVVEDPSLGEVIAVRSMIYLALSYDHRLVDGADAARFLSTVKARLEEGSFEAELGL
ncbi:MAG TPA: 2-oxoglutarate dehydrogenase, E2 component, dihydrolipoamide succinyltransferase [Streptosporangiaceae bacterium]|nr:2-oxoglutarate dehydrogenase, E2 component, dihydrolipoamide succinyltransferase [Streptosporangiaceae bacterium]